MDEPYNYSVTTLLQSFPLVLVGLFVGYKHSTRKLENIAQSKDVVNLVRTSASLILCGLLCSVNVQAIQDYILGQISLWNKCYPPNKRRWILEKFSLFFGSFLCAISLGCVCSGAKILSQTAFYRTQQLIKEIWVH
eukprot:TRINITY_DN4653_c0_g2_i1.p1 TRINITY_DN4653_c0_g2~~TRINITY_DN4653_c0_g2_i1.p1  ORF type:complete len:151 (-),score=15.68 TRINITY_DN4653_c0_g2_i1:60-467(-)